MYIFVITLPARDSGGAEYCNSFVLAAMCTNPTCTNPKLSVPIVPADQSRASIWGRDLILPGVANGTAVALPSSRCSQTTC